MMIKIITIIILFVLKLSRSFSIAKVDDEAEVLFDVVDVEEA